MKRIVIGKFEGNTAEEVREYCERARELTKDAVMSGTDGMLMLTIQLIEVLAREIEKLRG